MSMIQEETHHIKQVLLSGREIATEVVSLKYNSRYELLCDLYNLDIDSGFERVLFAYLAFTGNARDDSAPERPLNGNSRALYAHLLHALYVPELNAVVWLSKPLASELWQYQPLFHLNHAKKEIIGATFGGTSKRNKNWIIDTIAKTLYEIERFDKK